jgi:hypothetical protein
VYNITRTELQDRLDEPGSALRALPRGTFTEAGIDYGFQRVAMEPAGTQATAKRQRLTTKTKASGPPPPPALAAHRVASAPAVLTPRGSVTASLPGASSSSRGPGASTPVVLTPRRVESAPAAPTLTGSSPDARAGRAYLCRNLTDTYMNKLNTACRRRFAQEGHLSHTQRYREDARYREDCIRRDVPEWLVFHSTGHTPALTAPKVINGPYEGSTEGHSRPRWLLYTSFFALNCSWSAFLYVLWIYWRPGEPILQFSVGLECHPFRPALPVYISRGVCERHSAFSGYFWHKMRVVSFAGNPACIVR